MRSSYFGLLVILTGLISSETFSQPEVSTVAEMLQLLAKHSNPAKNIFLNTQRVEALIAQVQPDAELSASGELVYSLAQELNRAGRSAEAITEFSRLLRWLEENQGQRSDVLLIKKALAMAYLRLGEQENCLDHHHASSCLIPFQKGGIHHHQEGSRQAIRHLTDVLKETDDIHSKWLLNIAYMTIGEHPGKVPQAWLIPLSVFESDQEFSGFQDISMQAGISHFSLSGGVAIADFDGDKYLDIVTSSWGLTDPLCYYRNNADGTFSDHSEAANLVDQLGGLNLIQADYDNDGDVDILVLRGAWLGALGIDEGNLPNSLLRNDGEGRFTDVTIQSGLLSFHPTQTAAWADFDLDGNLDLFIGNESTLDPDTANVINAHRCNLFRNLGDGTFKDVAHEVGLDHIGFVKGVAWGDYDDDGFPDLYLSRHGQSNVLFHNDGMRSDNVWKFSDVTSELGVGQPFMSFPTWFWDFDNDGRLDLFVAVYENYYDDALSSVVEDYLGLAKSNFSRLYRNNGNGSFIDVTQQLNLDDVLLAMGANFGDLDNDGYLDFYVGTGQPSLATLVPNRMYRNQSGQIFHDITSAGAFGHLQKGHGIAFADLDNDGDQDVYAVMGGAYSGDIYPDALFRNPGTDNNWISFSLVGAKGTNRGAVGARIKLVLDQHEQNREIHQVAGFGSSFGSIPSRLDVGVGKAERIHLVEIRWPDSKQSVTRYMDISVNQFLEIHQDSSSPISVPLKQFGLGSDH